MATKTSKQLTNEWLSLGEAAEYLNIGKTKLYELARKEKIPSSRIDKKWTFNKKSLDKWVFANKPIEKFFIDLEFNIETNEMLREPQREGYLRASDFFDSGKKKAIVQIPVGCGKTGLAALLPLGLARGRVLIISPNLTIKEGLYEAMDITNRQKCFWRKVNVLENDQMIAGPYACTLDTGNISVAIKSHIVITNVHQLATNVDKWLKQFSENFFDMIIIDEAHHSAASSWKKVLSTFPNAKIIHMTATPFRSDRQKIDGEFIYRYPFRSATLKGYIKRLKANYIAPSEIHIEFVDKGKTKYTLDEVLKLKEEDWFSREVALAKPCNKHIVDSSLQKLEDLRRTGTKHQLIAVACSINHGREIRSMYRERGYSAEVIHSKQDKDKQKQIIDDLKNGTLDCIVQVQMLGEGFDHPKLSVAAIFRPFRTLAPYIQFVGRIMRVIVQDNSSHPDNLGHIVTHLGMNLDQRLKEFKQFEKDDQAFWEKVIGGDDPEVPKETREGKTRLRNQESGVIISDEIVEALWEEEFTTAEDKHIIEDLRERLKSLGLDPDQAEEIVKNSRQKGVIKQKPTEPFSIQPQQKLEELRTRLDERAKRTASILLNHVKLDHAGTELPYKYKSLKARSPNNFVSALILTNNEINKRLNKSRSLCTSEEFEEVIEELGEIQNILVRRVRKARSEYDKKQA